MDFMLLFFPTKYYCAKILNNVFTENKECNYNYFSKFDPNKYYHI